MRAENTLPQGSGATGNAFRRFWDLGYRALLPVIPPSAGVRNAGKRPGVRTGVVGWSGRAADSFRATPDTLDIWAEMETSVGLSCNASGVCGLDLDILEPGYADLVKAIAFEALGPTAVRIGRTPKKMLVYRCAKDTTYRRLLFDDGRPPEMDDKGKPVPQRPGLVELMAGPSKWFVVAGDHPETGKPYHWPDGVWLFDILPFASAEALEAFFSRLGAELPEAVVSGSSGKDRAAVDQEALKGDLDLIKDAMAAIPNGVLDYDGIYVPMAAALRGACQDDPDLGCDLFIEWAEMLVVLAEEDGNAPERVYQSLNPPFRLGASYIFDKAHQAGWVGNWFDPNPEAPELDEPFVSMFGDSKEIEPTIIRASDWDGQPVPEAEFLDERKLIPLDGMTNLTGPGAAGKTLQAMQLAIAAVTGTLWMGLPVRKGKVLFLSTEDNEHELQRRCDAICRAEGISLAKLTGLIFIDATRGSSAVMISVDGGSLVSLTKLHKLIVGLIQEHQPIAVFLDNRGQIVAGNEIVKGVAVGVCRQFNALASERHCAIVMLSHPSNTGMASGSGNSGNVAWINTPRASLLMRKPKETEKLSDDYYNAEDDGIRELIVNKRNYGRMGERINMVWQDGRYVCTDDLTSGRSSQAEKARHVFLKLLAWHTKQGIPASPLESSRSFAPKLFSRHKQGERIATGRFKETMDALLTVGVIETFTDKTSKGVKLRLAKAVESDPKTPGKSGALSHPFPESSHPPAKP